MEGTFPGIEQISVSDTNNILYAIYKATIGKQAPPPPVATNERKISFLLTDQGGVADMQFYRTDFKEFNIEETKANFSPSINYFYENAQLTLDVAKFKEVYPSTTITIADNSLLTLAIDISGVAITDNNNKANNIVITFRRGVQLPITITFTPIV